MKKRLPLILAFVFGVIYVVQYYVPGFASTWLANKTSDWIIVMSFFIYPLAIYSFLYYHIIRIAKQAPKWQYSIITLVCMIGMIFAGFYVEWGTNAKSLGDKDYVFQKLYDFLLVPLEATMFSLLAFYIASAAARAFRARNVEATLLLITAIIIMLSRVTIGQAMLAQLPAIGDWILEWPNTAARRAILIGVGLGGAATSLKILLGIERSYLGMR
jgi:hypothetical protein